MQTVERKIVKRGRSKSYACAYGGTQNTPRTSTSSTASSPSSPTSTGSNSHLVQHYRTNPLSPPETIDFTFKLMLLGDSGVGKTCLFLRYRDNTFVSGAFISTVGIDFRNKIVTVDNCNVKLQIWDTAGQERFRSVTHAYYRDAHALLLLFDVTNRQSYNNVKAWLGEIREYAQEDVVIMLLGNKSDCPSGDRVVKKDEGEKLARDYKVTYMETSAKTGQNVELAFMAIARELKSRKVGTTDGGKFNVQEYVREQTRRVTCAPFSVPCGSS
uniref:small monomeric GTPase n=2 Tax=Cacopsylla melanoneura TaxID=428564 RepID=A0A8D9DZV4_9HEMI